VCACLSASRAGVGGKSGVRDKASSGEEPKEKMARVEGAVGVVTFLEDSSAAVQKVEILKIQDFSNTTMTDEHV
jgi:hypothetical protein